MKELLKKFNYREQKRIAVINAEQQFLKAISKELKGVITDSEIDPRCPYEFMIIFVRTAKEARHFDPLALHNLTADGILWLCYPKKSSRLFTSRPERDNGWNSLNKLGFYGVRMISVDENWSAMRFRNIKYIKSTSSRYPKKVEKVEEVEKVEKDNI
jgi:hypothetical protein